MASSKGRDDFVAELRKFRVDRMQEVREWNVLGMLPGSNSMSIVSSFLHMLMHNANVGLSPCMTSALKLFLLLDLDVRKDVLRIMVMNDADVAHYLDLLGVKSPDDVASPKTDSDGSSTVYPYHFEAA